MFREGEEFASYAELRDKISEFERTEFVQLNVQKSKSIEAAIGEERQPKITRTI